MTRQYIGARYVPKVFGDWVENHEFEPLMIVTYLNNSYTSKKTVPATVGNPAENPEYWVCTGNYNAQVEEYRQITENVRSEMNTLSGRVEPYLDIKPVNVLSLGVKNDGSEDISEIINEHTARYPLFFPSGVYKVEHPIYIKNGIYGTGCTNGRDGNEDNDVTTFMDAIEGTTANQDVGVFNITGTSHSINIGGFNLVLTSYSRGLNISNSNFALYTLHDISIYGVRENYGFAFTPTTFCSKHVYGYNLHVFGSDKYCVGFYIAGNSSDDHLSNCFVMGCIEGVVTFSNILFLNDVHIWCGKIGFTTDPDGWWGRTRAVRSENAKVIATNLYVDTALILLSAIGAYAYIEVSNLVAWYDDAEHSDRYDASLLYGEGYAVINGGYIFPHNRLLNAFNNRHLRCTEVRVLTDRTDEGLMPKYPFVSDTKYFYDFHHDGAKYVECAKVYYNYGSTIINVIDDGSNMCELVVAYDNGIIVKKKTIHGGMTFFYKIDGNVITIYLLINGTGNASIYCSLGNASYGCATLIPTLLERENGAMYAPEQLGGSGGLTEVLEM